jgi:hypothetical protein
MQQSNHPTIKQFNNPINQQVKNQQIKSTLTEYRLIFGKS